MLYGIILKSDAAIALVPDMEAVLLGRRFANSSFENIDNFGCLGE